jgi:hypothetical protein
MIDVRHFATASLVRLEDTAVVGWVRGARPPGNVHHGSPRGAGLLRVVSKASGEPLFVASPRGAAPFAGDWTARAGGWSRARARAAVAGEVRFAGWLARAYARRGERLRALGTPLEVLRRGALEFGGSRVSSAYVLDPTLEVHSDGVTLRSGLAWRDGARVPGIELTRTYCVEGDGLAVEEGLAGPSPRGLRHWGTSGSRTPLGDGPDGPEPAVTTQRLTWRVGP